MIDLVQSVLSGKEKNMSKWLWRKINFKLLFGAGLVYRASVIVLNTLFLWIWACLPNDLIPTFGITGKLGIAIGTSLPWAVVNMTWYYVFHGLLLKTHVFAKGEKEDS